MNNDEKAAYTYDAMNRLVSMEQGGAENAISEVLYGTGKLKSAGDAFWRGAKTGAVISGLENITDHVGPYGVAGSRLLGKTPKEARNFGTGTQTQGQA